MWKEAPRTRKKEVLSSHLVESSRPSLTTVSLEVPVSDDARIHEVKAGIGPIGSYRDLRLIRGLGNVSWGVRDVE